MSVEGLMSTVAWTELHQAIVNDGLDLRDGKCGPAAATWLRENAVLPAVNRDAMRWQVVAARFNSAKTSASERVLEGLGFDESQAARLLADIVDDTLAPVDLVCTCPSGDGSLRYPCAEHPPTEHCDQSLAVLEHLK